MTTEGTFNREVYFDIVEPLGVLTSHSTGWRKELNLVSWNGGPPKYDIRDWSPDHEHMSRGVTLHEKEMRHIFELLKQRRNNERRRRQQDATLCQGASPAPAPPPISPEQASQEPLQDDFDDSFEIP